MALKICSWKKLSNGRTIPVCRPNYISKLKDMDYANLINIDSANKNNTHDNLDICWSYFKKNYHGYCLKQESSNDSSQNFISSALNFIVSFKELDSVSNYNGYKQFHFKTDQHCSIRKKGYYYISDKNGLALLKINYLLEIYYYDFQRKTVNYTKFVCRLPCYIKLASKTIWIWHHALADVQAVYIKNDKCFHIKSSINYIPFLKKRNRKFKLMSDRMFIGSDNPSKCVNFCRMLYIDETKLLENKTNNLDFQTFDIPNYLEPKQNLYIEGLFKDTLILRNYDSLADDYLKTVYFLRYEGYCLKSCTKLDTGSSLCDFALTILPGIGKMIVDTEEENFTKVVDIRTFKVNQILKTDANFHLREIKSSLDSKELILFGERCNLNGSNENVVFRLVLYNGLSLKDICIHFIVNNYAIDQIYNLPMPSSLIKQISAVKIY